MILHEFPCWMYRMTFPSGNSLSLLHASSLKVVFQCFPRTWADRSIHWTDLGSDLRTTNETIRITWSLKLHGFVHFLFMILERPVGPASSPKVTFIVLSTLDYVFVFRIVFLSNSNNYLSYPQSNSGMERTCRSPVRSCTRIDMLPAALRAQRPNKSSEDWGTLNPSNN